MRKCFFLITLFLSAVTVAAQQMSVDGDIRTITMNPGEAQSTVVPPGKKITQCPKGRFLVTNDQLLIRDVLRSRSSRGLVMGRDLDKPDGEPIPSTFEQVPHPEYYKFGSNDHDLVSLSNGDVLFLTSVFARGPLDPKPPWFDVTYREGFGPGARSNLLAWLSTDCGENFKYLSEFDSALKEYGGGLCANPQFPRSTAHPDHPHEPVFNMGGTDGQLVKVDPANDNLYLTFGCFGYKQDEGRTSHFELKNEKLLKTLVAVSENRGMSWRFLGFVEQAYWRMGVVPLRADKLAFGLSNVIGIGNKNQSGKYDFETAIMLWPRPWGYAQDTFNDNPKIPGAYINVNMHAHTIVTRVPDSDSILLAFPNTITDGGRGHGYRVIFYDPVKKEYVDTDPILPTVQNLDNFIMHLVAIDLGEGPVLLYWYDVDSNAKTATLRGRLIMNKGRYSHDFAVSQAGGNPRSFDLTIPKGSYWYGDYLTAGGYVEGRPVSTDFFASLLTYNYYPMWVEPDGTVRYTHVKVVEDKLNPTVIDIPSLNIPAGDWRPQLRPVAISKMRLSGQERELIMGYDKRSRSTHEPGNRCRRIATRK
jgi:hypothetical protein